MVSGIGSVGRAIGVTAIWLLGATVAQAQFQLFPPSPPPQRVEPAPRPQPSPPPQKVQRPAPQKAAQPAQKTQSTPAPSAPYGEVRTACQTELKGTCAGVLPGSADSVLCLRRNFAVHSPACQAALTRAGTPVVQPAAAAANPPTPPAGTGTEPRRVSTDRVAAPSGPEEPLKPLPTPSMRATQEARFISRYCKEDHSLLCQGVTFGQGRVLKCLAAQQRSLTNECRDAMGTLR